MLKCDAISMCPRLVLSCINTSIPPNTPLPAARLAHTPSYIHLTLIIQSLDGSASDLSQMLTVILDPMLNAMETLPLKQFYT